MLRIVLLVLGLLVGMVLCARPAQAQIIYDDKAEVTSLFADPPKPRMVGDMVIILVNEDMTTAKIDDLRNDKTFGVAATAEDTTNGSSGGILGFVKGIFGVAGVNLGGRQDERTQRSDRVATIMPCTVVQVMPNGYLVVEGQREVKVNQDQLSVSMGGIVRPRDINRNGEVVSGKVAEMQMLVKRKTPRGILDTIFKILF
ncbi:MAG: flagellar basal body L-ring protein FlgH [Armatimonadetes bacterium]|nr:flagellar basal body L-ring protein FlgH [Armatimonadota bacterium]